MELIAQNTVAHLNLMLIHDLIWEKEEGIKMPQIYVFYGWSFKDNCEVASVRFERENGLSTTFKLDKKLTNKLVKSPVVCMDLRVRQELQAMVLAKHEFPKEWLTATTPHPLDGFTQGDLWSLERNTYELGVKVAKQVKEIMEISRRLLPLTTDRVYDLYMSLNVDSLNLSRFKLRFDRIYPKLPDLTNDDNELAPIIIGIKEEFGLEPNDNPTYNQVVAQLKRCEQIINDQVQKHIKKANLKGEALEMLKKEITSILMATSHYTGKVFGFDGAHGSELLHEVANDILDKLYRYRTNGRNLGLDISSWFVWEYPEDGSQPVRATDPELDFHRTILEGYTDTFVDLLVPILMDSGHADAVKPYKFHVKADLSDGRAIGTMTRVTR